MYEKLIYNQLYQYFENILFPSHCGSRKGYSTQHCLLLLTEKFQEAIDRGNQFGALLTDLSKTFDSLDHAKQLMYLAVNYMSFDKRRMIMKAFIESQ